jgi:hypothetical protein
MSPSWLDIACQERKKRTNHDSCRQTTLAASTRTCLLLALALAAAAGFPLQAQTAENQPAMPDERLFFESKWRYSYTLHAASNTVIHRADEDYDYYLYFRYDYSYQEYLQGKLSVGNWSLNGRTLFYSFQYVNKFDIIQLNKSILVLEFTQRYSKGTYQYHFVRVEGKDAPFVKPANELPEVIVEAAAGKREKSQPDRGAVSRRNKKKRVETAAPTPYINIELIGGGYYGGVDPVVKDFIHVKTDGRLVREFQSVNQPLLSVKRNISREELELLADFVTKEGFFKMERVYDCRDATCSRRKGMKPVPVPLRLSISVGQQRKVVTIAIWGRDENGMQYVDYPPALDKIIQAIQQLANRPEEAVVRK